MGGSKEEWTTLSKVGCLHHISVILKGLLNLVRLWLERLISKRQWSEWVLGRCDVSFRILINPEVVIKIPIKSFNDEIIHFLVSFIYPNILPL